MERRRSSYKKPRGKRITTGAARLASVSAGEGETTSVADCLGSLTRG